MKRFSALLASVPLVISSASALAGEVQFNVPGTDRATQSAEILTRAAYALDDVVTREGRLTNLWVFPTSDARTVFARYTLTAANATEHLALVELRANGTAKVQKLTGAERPAADWSASIGNGHTSNSSTSPKAASEAGVPGPAHWTARIGTGRSAQSAEAKPDEPVQVSIAANGHWTAKVGTARASEASCSISTSTTSPRC
jgi:hypothetical protein